MRFTEKDDFLGYAIPQTNAVGDKQINIAVLGKSDNLDEASVTVICQNYIVGEPIRQFGRIEDVLGKHDIVNAVEVLENGKEIFKRPYTKQNIDLAHQIYMGAKYKEV